MNEQQDDKLLELQEWMISVVDGDTDVYYQISKILDKLAEIRSRPAPSPAIDITHLHPGFYDYNRSCNCKDCLKIREDDTATIRNQTLDNVLPTEEELHALKHAVCEAIQNKIDGCWITDGYYHKLKSLRTKEQAP